MTVIVTVGICAKNSEKTIRTTLISVFKQDFPHNLMEIIIIDDGSTDKTLIHIENSIKESDIKVKLFSQEWKGLGYSRQKIVDNAEGKYLIWVDDDFFLPKDIIRKQVNYLDKNPRVGASRPDIIFTGNTLVFLLESLRGLLVDAYPKVLGTGSSIFRLKAIRQVGGFDINITGAGEDKDLSHRIRMSGWKLSVNESIKFYHKGKGTWRTLWKRHYWYGYGNHYLFHKHKRLMLPWKNLFPFAPLISFMSLSKMHKINRASNASIKKRLYLFVPIYFFYRSIAWSIGFGVSHLNGYGHS